MTFYEGIIIGAFIPSILYPFTSLTAASAVLTASFADKGVSYNPGLRGLEIVLVEGTLKEADIKRARFDYEGRLAIPYRYMVALGILLAFSGIGFVAFGLMRNDAD